MTEMRFAVTGPERTTLRLADGVDLVADLYRPVAPGRHPVLLMRQPYGRAIASTLTLAHPAWYASHGYIVVIQDVRGCGDSGGIFRLFETEAEDGAATLAWAAELSRSNGQVATYGFSYQAVTQFLALAGATAAGTKRPDAIIPSMGGWTIRDDWAFAGGAFCMSSNISWACQMGAENARLANDYGAFSALSAAARSTPWTGPVPARPNVLAEQAAFTHYAAWLTDEPSYWAKIAPAQVLAKCQLDIPGLHIGGWQDFLLEGTLDAYRAFATNGALQRLVVGPWAHSPWGRCVGALDLGPTAVTNVDNEAVAFLDHVLKGRDANGPAVRLFDVGACAWRDLEKWPEPKPTAFFLASDGRAATASTGRLLAAAPAGRGEDHLVHDPWRPVPAVGGCWGTPGGYQDRAILDDRSDVAVYNGAPLTQTVRLAGSVNLHLFVAADMPSHDLHATLSVVGCDGRAITLTSGHLRVAESAAPGARALSMRSVCSTLYSGQALRLSLQASAWPAFAVNPGTGGRPEDVGTYEARVTTLSIRNGGDMPSRLLLPMIVEAPWARAS